MALVLGLALLIFGICYNLAATSFKKFRWYEQSKKDCMDYTRPKFWDLDKNLKREMIEYEKDFEREGVIFEELKKTIANMYMKILTPGDKIRGVATDDQGNDHEVEFVIASCDYYTKEPDHYKAGADRWRERHEWLPDDIYNSVLYGYESIQKEDERGMRYLYSLLLNDYSYSIRHPYKYVNLVAKKSYDNAMEICGFKKISESDNTNKHKYWSSKGYSFYCSYGSRITTNEVQFKIFDKESHEYVDLKEYIKQKIDDIIDVIERYKSQGVYYSSTESFNKLHKKDYSRFYLKGERNEEYYCLERSETNANSYKFDSPCRVGEIVFGVVPTIHGSLSVVGCVVYGVQREISDGKKEYWVKVITNNIVKLKPKALLWGEDVFKTRAEAERQLKRLTET